MEPKDVNQKKFPIESVLYDDKKFSVVLGLWDGEKRIGVRWNDNLPTAFGHPVWLIWPKNLSIVLLAGLLEQHFSSTDEILKALSEFLPTE